MILRPRKAQTGLILNPTGPVIGWIPWLLKKFATQDADTREFVDSYKEARGEGISLKNFKKRRDLQFPSKLSEQLFDAIPTALYARPTAIAQMGLNTILKKKREEIGPLIHNELWAKDLGAKGDYRYIEESPYKPEHGDKSKTYYKVRGYDRGKFLNEALNEFSYRPRSQDAVPGEKPGDVEREGTWWRDQYGNKKMNTKQELYYTYNGKRVSENPFANYTVYNNDRSVAPYVSMYDKWDFKAPWLTGKFIKPAEVYDKIYYEENPERKYNEYQAGKAEEEYDKWAKEANKNIDQIDSLTTNKLPITDEFLRGYNAVQDSLRKYSEREDWAKERARNTFKYKVRDDITSTPSRGLIRNRDEERERYRVPK